MTYTNLLRVFIQAMLFIKLYVLIFNTVELVTVVLIYFNYKYLTEISNILTVSLTFQISKIYLRKRAKSERKTEYDKLLKENKVKIRGK